MIRPPGLDPFLSTNDILPSSTLATLDVYLSQISDSLKNVESDIIQLQTLLDTKQDEYQRLQLEHRACAGAKSSIRRFPGEILGLIFGFAVGSPPFNRYIDVAHLRGVCSSWRQAALSTPGLWTGLTIDIDKWCHSEAYGVGLREEHLFQLYAQDISPWLRILSRRRPFHLTLTSHDQTPFKDLLPLVTLTRYLMTMEPKPSFLTLKSPSALSAATNLNTPIPAPSAGDTTSPNTPSSWLSVQQMLITEDATLYTRNLHISEAQFPNLLALKINHAIPFHLQHSSLQTLFLDSEEGMESVPLQPLLQSLPRLQELKLGYLRVDDHDIAISPAPVLAHESLETLIVNSEELLFTFCNISFPHLRYLSISGYGSTAFHDEVVQSHIRPATYSRSTFNPILVRISGSLYQPLLQRLIQCLPCNTHLDLNVQEIMNRDDDDEEAEEDEEYSPTLPVSIESDNIEAIFCGEYTASLWWLETTSNARRMSSRPLTIYLPTGCEGWMQGASHRDELLARGFSLEVLSDEALDEMIDALAPAPSRFLGWWGISTDLM
jgi:F-box-like